MHFGRKMVRNAVHNAFLNILTIRTPFPCVPADFSNGNVVSTRFPRNEPWYRYHIEPYQILTVRLFFLNYTRDDGDVILSPMVNAAVLEVYYAAAV